MMNDTCIIPLDDQPPTEGLVGCYELKVQIPNTVDCFESPNNCDSLKFDDPYHGNQTEIGPGICAVHCANYSFKFVGISKEDCRCENNILIYTRVNDTYCNNTCFGNGETYTCGAKDYYTFYNTKGTLESYKLPKIPTNEKINIIHNLNNDTQYNYIGCLKDYCDQRIFLEGPIEDNGMTIDMCMDHCR